MIPWALWGIFCSRFNCCTFFVWIVFSWSFNFCCCYHWNHFISLVWSSDRHFIHQIIHIRHTRFHTNFCHLFALNVVSLKEEEEKWNKKILVNCWKMKIRVDKFNIFSMIKSAAQNRSYTPIIEQKSSKIHRKSMKTWIYFAYRPSNQNWSILSNFRQYKALKIKIHYFYVINQLGTYTRKKNPRYETF